MQIKKQYLFKSGRSNWANIFPLGQISQLEILKGKY